MVVLFPSDVSRRLADIEAAEGTPAVELVHEAVAVWTQLSAAERRQVLEQLGGGAR